MCVLAKIFTSLYELQIQICQQLLDALVAAAVPATSQVHFYGEDNEINLETEHKVPNKGAQLAFHTFLILA